MEEAVVEFRFPDISYGIVTWFMEELKSLSGVRHRESQGVGVILGEPGKCSHEPGLMADIVIPGTSG